MADLMTALRNADAAGDTVAAQRITAMIQAQGSSGQSQAITQPQQRPEMQQPVEQQDPSMMQSIGNAFTGSDRATPEIDALSEIGNAPELNEMSFSAFKTSLGLLATGDEEKAKGVIQSNIPEAQFSTDTKGNTIVNLPSGQYALNKPGVSPQDVARGVFNLAAFTPAGRAGTMAKAAGGAAATEVGLQAVTQQVGGGDINAKEVAIAGALGAGGKLAENAIGAGYRAIKGTPSPENASLLAQSAEYNVPVMTTDVMPPSTLAGKMARSTGEKIPIVGTGQARAEQQELRQEAVQQFVDKYQSPSYQDIVTSLKNKSKGVKSSAGSILGNTGEKLDAIGDIPTTRTTDAIDAAVTELTKPNVRADQSAIDELTALKELMDKPQTFSSLKENRTIARDIVESFGKGDRSQLPSRSKALLGKAISGMGSDMDDFAKTNLTPKEFSSWKKANAVYANEATKLRKSKIKNILDKGDVTPENVGSMLFSQKPSEVRSLYESLTTQGKDNARSALIYRAFDNASKRAGGISPNAFSSELNKVSKNTDVFFRGEQRSQLEGFKRLMETTRRAQDAAVETPTGQQLLGAGAGYAAFTDLGATLGLGGTAGGLARLYESAPVRNALIRLSSVPKGSSQFEKALREAQAAMTSSAQAIRAETEE
jgi:hypothetical protein